MEELRCCNKTETDRLAAREEEQVEVEKEEAAPICEQQVAVTFKLRFCEIQTF